MGRSHSQNHFSGASLGPGNLVALQRSSCDIFPSSASIRDKVRARVRGRSVAASSLLQLLYHSAGWMFGCGAGVWCVAVMSDRLGRVIEDGGFWLLYYPSPPGEVRPMVLVTADWKTPCSLFGPSVCFSILEKLCNDTNVTRWYRNTTKPIAGAPAQHSFLFNHVDRGCKTYQSPIYVGNIRCKFPHLT